jgi:signal transduction histidine kinase
MQATPRRILLIDDNASIHADFRKILAGGAGNGALDAAAVDFFSSTPKAAAPAPTSANAPLSPAAPRPNYEIDSALQGEEALAKVTQAVQEGRPYALAFCDVRMPPGWDGVETLEKLYAADAHLQAVLCTAFSDFTYEQTIARIGQGDRLLILKKPFDPIEVQQLAAALTEKWSAAARVRKLVADVQAAEQEARSYASSLEFLNMALRTDKATAEAQAEARTHFLLNLVDHLGVPAAAIDRSIHSLPGDRHADPAAASIVRSLQWSAQRLNDGLAEARSFARLELPAAECAAPAELVPADICAGILARLEPLASLRAVEIELCLDPSAGHGLLGDPLLVEVVVGELLRFAIVESDAGRIEISARTGTFGMRVEIHAPSARIAPDELSSAFEPFASSEGLALALSRKAAQRLDGDVQARCDESGLRLSASLPMMSVQKRAAA